jgi:hypothetical protein
MPCSFFSSFTLIDDPNHHNLRQRIIIIFVCPHGGLHVIIHPVSVGHDGGLHVDLHPVSAGTVH